MQISLGMGPGFEQTVREMGQMGSVLIEACDDGLQDGGQLAATHVSVNYLNGQALQHRTGNLAKAVQSWPEGLLHVVIGVREDAAVNKYKYLLGDEQVTITPKHSKYLTIPIGEALTGSGVPRFESAADAEEKLGDLFIIQGTSNLLLGYKRGKRGKFRPLFVLVTSVLVQGTGALYDGVMESVDDMANAIQRQIDRRL